MFPRIRGPVVATLTSAALCLAGLAATPSAASPSAGAPSTGHTVTTGTPVPFGNISDSPAAPFVDKDGTFHYQESDALYGATDNRSWGFFTGTDFDSATSDSGLDNAVNPANADDKNNDTTWRCNNSPTGLSATYSVGNTSYAQKNYCDLVGTWVDPDTGDWYGLVHNEFTPAPFNDGLHYDAIDYAVSTDQGHTWTIKDHAITSPYSTQRGDTTQFPGQTYYYGDGDQRLFVDTASGYFYVYYGSRVIDKSGGWKAFYEHVARAPIASKMAPDSWQKWYDGSWSQPGQGGKESNLVPVDATNSTGYTPPANEYDPANTGTAEQQIAAGQMPATSPLFVMDVTYDAYLGLYIGEPQGVDQSGSAPQQFYATADLTSQKWTLLGDTGGYHTASWYRWFLDGANKTGNTVVGKTFRSYCAWSCANGANGEYTDVTIDSPSPATPVDTGKTYRIANASGRVLAQATGGSGATSLAAPTGSALEGWNFVANGDGSYRVVNSGTHKLLGVDSAHTAGRAWGAKPTVAAAGSGGPSVGQQWFLVPSSSTAGGFRLVNRYSGLVLGLSSDGSRLAETAPTRSWTDTTGSAVGGARTAAEQTLTFTPLGSAAETVTVADPGNQSSKAGTALSLQLTGTDSAGKALTFSASKLPAGLSISPAGLVSGTPTTAGTTQVTVTASSGTASSSVTFTWSVTAALTGTHTLTISGEALDDPNHSVTAGTQLITWAANGGSNQNWVFTQQADGSYQISNGQSNLCMDVSGGSTAAGAQVIQWTCTGGSNQRWTVTAVSGGYTVVSRSSGLLLTTAATSDGSLVTQQADSGSALQHWTIN
ncbi:RICIN domain-containing protein [Kitasatospora sp. GAS1066B]|uniref:RICIN domain-containing protein n=1 Tax=Kitasatospora sp. GAS1066B TaxID=3156271 RepID=UPI003512C17A